MPKRGGGGGGKIPEVVEGTVKKFIKKADVKTPHGSRTPGSGSPGSPGGSRTPNTPSPRPEISRRVSQKQGRHLKDNPNHNGGGYMNSQADAQSVLDAVHNGDATIIGTTKQGHLLVQYDGVTGYNNNVRATIADQPTNVFMIKGTASPSVVPTSPNARPAP